jgi:serine/threonine-protein kinase
MSDVLSASPRYEILAELGRGTTGVVYKARCTILNRLVAIKSPRPSAELERSVQLKYFLREARAVAMLTLKPDPNIPTIHEVGEFEGQPYYMRELIDGVTLEQGVHGGSIKLRDGLIVLASIAGAVQRVHAQGLAHRTLHPSNVLVVAGGSPKLIGFGHVGPLSGSAWLPPAARGTPAAMDVRALQQMLSWLCLTLRRPIPAALRALEASPAVASAGAFAQAMERINAGDEL